MTRSGFYVSKTLFLLASDPLTKVLATIFVYYEPLDPIGLFEILKTKLITDLCRGYIKNREANAIIRDGSTEQEYVLLEVVAELRKLGSGLEKYGLPTAN